ncbi:MAG TPA: nuclear transport factor 2 family protein [Longimicrobium sp.]|jgi:hypothetical protein
MQSPDTAAAGPESLALEFLGRVWGPAHDLDAIDELMTEDYVITTGGKRIEGRDAFKAWVRQFQTVLGDARTDSVEAFASAAGDRIVSRWVCSGINRGMWACRRTAAASPSPASPSRACATDGWRSAGWSAARGSCTRS